MSRSRPLSRRGAQSATQVGRRGLRIFDIFLAVVILGLLAIVVSRLDRVELRKITGAVVVIDGDTIMIGGNRLRLRGMDAPERDQTCQRQSVVYECGRSAKMALSNLVASQPVECSGWQRDKYRRLLVSCMSGGVDIGRQLVLDGWAVGFGDFDAEEAAAKKAARGLWAGSFDRPRQWRETHGNMVESDHDMLAAFLDWLKAIVGLAP